MEVKEIGKNNLESINSYNRTNLETKDNKKADSNISAQNEKIIYEKTISDSLLSGLKFIEFMEEQIKDSKFFIQSEYGKIGEDLSDINFVINNEFIENIGRDKALGKQLEEDIKYLSEFAKEFKAKLISLGEENVNQLWICDENGNWSGMSIIKYTNQNSAMKDSSFETLKILQEKAEKELKAHFGDRFKGLRIKWLKEKDEEKESSKTEEKENSSQGKFTVSRRVGVNAAKLSARISAARTAAQLQTVIADIASDLKQVEEGLANGSCSQAEVAKARALMAMAQGKMGQVDNREPTTEEESAFNMASLM